MPVTQLLFTTYKVICDACDAANAYDVSRGCSACDAHYVLGGP